MHASNNQKIVVVFDVCSSTMILEDLLYSENGNKWCKLIKAQKKYLSDQQEILNFELYKFLGDGWILLFPIDTKGVPLLKLLHGICEHFREEYRETINPLISCDIRTRGLTFGIDKGTLIPLMMEDNQEYVGRAINVAARLQSSIKDKDEKPQYKVLMSKNVFSGFSKEEQKLIRDIYPVEHTVRTLRNIAGSRDFRCRKITLLSK